MLFDLQNQQEGWASSSGQYQRCRGTGGRQQRFLDDEPPLCRGDDFYLKGFWKLCSERQYGEAWGPIPWSKIVLYGVYQKLDDNMMEVFEVVIRRLDEAYLKWNRDQKEARAQQAKPKKKKYKRDELG